MKYTSLKYLLCPALLAIFFTSTQAAPFGPEGHKTEWTQPSGVQLELRVFGDEYSARTETVDGYTVIFNEVTRAYHFATVSSDGNSLVPTATLADNLPPRDFPKHLGIPRAQVRKAKLENHLKYDGDRAARWEKRVRAARNLRDVRRADGQPGGGPQGAPVIGQKTGLTILVQFPDDSATPAEDPTTFPTTRAKVERYCNEEGYTDDGNTGSVRDYFADQSEGKLDYLQAVTEIITLPRPRNYYNYSDYPTNKVFRGDAGQVLVEEAIAVLQSQSFNFTGCSKDGRNNVLATNIFFAGKDSGVWLEGLWPQKSNLAAPFSVGTSTNPAFIYNFQITNISDAAPVIGTFCHESGHLLLDYPDLYDYGDDSAGVGYHCLMGAGNNNNSGKTPAPLNAYFKEICGWSDTTEITAQDFLQVSLPTTGNKAYKIRNPLRSTEFFMVENRGSGDKWAAYSRDKGIAIWHVDELKANNNAQQMTEAEHYHVALVQADGANDLESNINYGDTQDLFDLVTPLFTDNTNPASKWWGGAASGFMVEVLTPVSANTTVLFGDVPPNTIILKSPDNGEMLFRDSTFPVKWKANITGEIKVELLKGGVLHSIVSNSTPNDGVFSWRVSKTLVAASDYSIRLSSVSNPIPCSDTSSGNFTILAVTFPTTAEMPRGWYRPAGVAGTWKVSSKNPYEGRYCLVSNRINDGKKAAIAYKSNFVAGAISFYAKVSSENKYDGVTFAIDGVLQQMNPLPPTQIFAGLESWTYFSFPVGAGTHTFTWTYKKDSSYVGGLDMAWLDGVTLPPTTQEISVEKPLGLDRLNGTSVNDFGALPVRAWSTPHVFTIRNTGKAELTGLSAITEGGNARDFVVGNMGATVLTPGASTTFEVRCSPQAVGPRATELYILSNDTDEGRFRVSLTGEGSPAPTMSVYQTATVVIVDNATPLIFGRSALKTSGNTKTITVKNTGSLPLEQLSLTKTGAHAKDYKVSALPATSLAPGQSTTFSITFVPQRKGIRKATIQLTSNDTATGTFDIKVVGIGTLRSSSPADALTSDSNYMVQNIPFLITAVAPGPVEFDGAAALAKYYTSTERSVAVYSSNASAEMAVRGSYVSPNYFTPDSNESVQIIDGLKYRLLAVRKSRFEATPEVEVSTNLLDWYSGPNYTTTLANDGVTLEVRDNTPFNEDAPRYIRMREAGWFTE